MVADRPKESATPGRKRSETTRRAILDAAFGLLEEEGFDRLSIEGVAARARVGKATIYRWWSSKGMLAVEAFLDAVAPVIAFPDTGSARADILHQMHALAELYRGPTGRFVREMIALSLSDAAMRAAFIDGFLAPRRAAAFAVFRLGQERGELRADLDPAVAIDGVYGAIYYRLLVSDGVIDDGFVNELARSVLAGILAKPAAA
jgi:AcrR family transcriptional regulator